MKNKKGISLLAIIIIALAITLGISAYYFQSQSQNQPQKYAGAEKIVFGVETSLLTAPVWIAENKGYFQEQGLDVEIKEFDSGRAALAAMLKEGNPENLDMVTAAQTPVMFNSFARDDYAIISAMVTSINDLKVIARKDKGIQHPSHLKGKKIGITKGSTGHYFLYLFLDYYGLKFSDVEAVDMKAGELAQAIVDGRVDAISTWEPHISKARKQLGENALVTDIRYLFREDFYFISYKNFIAKNPIALERFLKAIDKAEEFIKENRAESIGIVSERLKLDKKAADSLWDDYNYRLVLDQSIVKTLQEEAKWAIENKLVNATQIPDYSNYIFPDALEKVKPKASTLTVSGEK